MGYTLQTPPDCDQVDIPSQYADKARAFDKNLKEGTCASVGYTVADGTTTKTVPVLGKLTIKKFKKAMNIVGATPSGTYRGEKKVLGVDVKGSVTVKDSSHVQVVITASGAVSLKINCPNENFKLSGSKVTLNSTCIDSALSKNKVQLKSVTYSSSADTIMLKVHKITDITVVLGKNFMNVIVNESGAITCLKNSCAKQYSNCM